MVRIRDLVRGPRGREINRLLFAAGEKVAVEAQIAITRGAVSGKNHVPSRPGQPPNNDTGVLAGNIEVVNKRPGVVEVSSNAPYSEYLEYGTSKMAARPFMRPTRDKMEKPVRRFVQQGINRIMRRP